MNKFWYTVLLIVVMTLTNYLIRALPFVLFRNESNTPKVVEYLGKALPPAMMSFLVIYCIKDINLLSGSHGLPELIGVSVAMIIHWWKKNTLLSISVATILYMIMVQMFF